MVELNGLALFGRAEDLRAGALTLIRFEREIALVLGDHQLPE